MKSLIICKSIHHKNTLKIARFMAKILNAKILEPEELNVNHIDTYDVIGFGSGIYYSMHHESLFTLLDRPMKVKKTKSFIFSTSGSWNLKLINDFNVPLRDKLTSKGFNVIGMFNCRGYDTIGPLKHIGGLNKGKPDVKDIKRACLFAEGIKLTVEALS
jgi:flavodoxin